jgi:hypothetical protein
MPEFERRSTDAARVRVVVLGALARQRLTGLILLATAAFSFCPVWHLLGVNTCGK